MTHAPVPAGEAQEAVVVTPAATQLLRYRGPARNGFEPIDAQRGRAVVDGCWCYLIAAVAGAGGVAFFLKDMTVRRYTPERVTALSLLSIAWVLMWYGGWKLSKPPTGRPWERRFAILARVSATAYMLVPFLWSVETWGSRYIAPAPLTKTVWVFCGTVAAAALPVYLLILNVRIRRPWIAAAAGVLAAGSATLMFLYANWHYRIGPGSLELFTQLPFAPLPSIELVAASPSFMAMVERPIETLMLLPWLVIVLTAFVVLSMWVIHAPAARRDRDGQPD